MKAALYYQYGPPEVIKLEEIDTPKPKSNEMLIKIYASTVNRTDCGFRSAEYFISRFFSGLFRPNNKILGNEFAGEIVDIGSEITQYNIGDRIFGYNDEKFGGHAEFKIAKETDAIAFIPEHSSYTEAAALTEGAHYALCDLRAAKISKGQEILINGTTGAIGSAAVQLAKHFGATVTAVCDTKNIELVKSLGADSIIDYQKEDFTKLTKSFDIIFDAVGKSTFGKCKPLLKKKGIYMSTELGPGSQNIFLALITPLFGGKRLLFPIPLIKKQDVEFLKDLYVQGKFKPVIDRVYPLEQIVEAHRYVETGMKTGNVVIQIAREN